MYEAFFRLRHRPFAAAAQVDRYFPGAIIEQARKTTLRCVERAEGPALVVGPAGTGKTLLFQLLAKQLSAAKFKTAVLTCGNFGARKALLQAILFELGQPYRGLDEGELRLALVDFALASRGESQGLALLVDEAHTLPLRLLEELRLITNLASGGEQRVRIVLGGNGSLEELFSSPKLDSFSQRIAARTYLGPFDRAETALYLRSQVTACHGDPNQLLAADVPETVYRATEGIPRLINQVCDHALILAYVAGQNVVRGRTIEEAWADLQQLPARWTDERTATGAVETVVEFGQLDAVEERPQAIPFQRRSGRAEPSFEERLLESERLLNQLDEEFVPAGAIRPDREESPEIVMTPDADPFGDQFLEEEIIIDRYASLDAEMFAGCPTVTSIEGQELGHSLSAAARAIGDGSTGTSWGASTPDLSAAEIETYTSTFEVGAGEVVRPFVSEGPRSPAAPVGRGVDDSAPGRHAADPFDDSDLIVIEDDPTPAATPLRARPEVRRQEYRQLFAKLRRG